MIQIALVPICTFTGIYEETLSLHVGTHDAHPLLLSTLLSRNFISFSLL